MDNPIEFYKDLHWKNLDEKIPIIRKTAPNTALEIQFRDIVRLDPACLGWLFLQARQNKNPLRLVFDGDISSGCYYETIHLFYLLEKERNSIPIHIEHTNQKYKFRQSFSDDFFPIVFIGQDTDIKGQDTNSVCWQTPIQDAFVKIKPKIESDDFWKHFDYGKQNQKNALYSYVQQSLLKMSAREAGISPYEKASYIYYLKLLLACDFIKPHLEKLTGGCTKGYQLHPSIKQAGIQGMNPSQVREYWSSLEPFFAQKVDDKPVLFIFMFSVIATNFKKNLGAKPFKFIQLRNLHLLAYEYYSRLLELISNIRAHASTKEGLLFARVYQKNGLIEMFPGLEDYFALPEFPQVSDFLNVVCLDIGDKGIRSTALADWEKRRGVFQKNGKPKIAEAFKEDVAKLKECKDIKPFFTIDAIEFLHQKLRTCAGIGLVMFAKLINRNQGFFAVVSQDAGAQNEDQRAVLRNWDIKKSDFQLNSTKSITNFNGTRYFTLLPINPDTVTPIAFHDDLFVSIDTPAVLTSMAKGEIRHFEIVDAKSTLEYNKKTHVQYNKEAKVVVFDYKNVDLTKGGEEMEAKRIAADIEKKTLDNREASITSILALDCSEVDGSKLGDIFRLIAFIQLEKPKRSTVIYNLAEDLCNEIVELVGMGYWSDTHFILVFNTNAEPFFIGGSKNEKWKWLNRYLFHFHGVSNNHLSRIIGKKKQPVNFDGDRKKINDIIQENPLFFTSFKKKTPEKNTPVLIPFELYLRGRDNETLLETRVKTALYEKIQNTFQNNSIANPGYLFSNTHFRLGSKIHVDRFYYAEKLFVNSYYYTRIGFDIFSYIFKHLNTWLKDSEKASKKRVVLLGYGLYSDMMLSFIRFLLDQAFQRSYSFTNTIVQDSDLSIENEKLVTKADHIILVIPIGSTLLTSVKIRKKLNRMEMGEKILGLPITYIVAAPDWKEDSILSHYWAAEPDKTNRIITLKDDERPNKKQKYFIYVQAVWFEPEKCKLCFPNMSKPNLYAPMEEKALFETNRASVVPAAILSLPQCGKRTDRLRDKSATIDTILRPQHITPHHHIVRGTNHYLHYIRVREFYRDNRERIAAWLTKVREHIEPARRKVVLIAPEQGSNADFANDVNEIVFHSSATLLRFNPQEVRINFYISFSHIFVHSPEIILIDDTVCSGKTLDYMRSAIQEAFPKYLNCTKNDDANDSSASQQEKSLKVISLLDRSSNWFNLTGSYEIFSFLSLHAPPYREGKLCNLCEDERRYDKMLKMISDPKLEWLIEKKRENIRQEAKEEKQEKNKSDETNDSEQKRAELKQKNYLERIKYIDKLAEFFDKLLQEYKKEEKPDIALDESYLEERLKSFLLTLHGKEGLEKEQLEEVFASIDTGRKINLIKTLAYPPFPSYRIIRHLSCRLVLSEFQKTVASLKENPRETKTFSFLFIYLSVLLKTIGKLNLNLILRKQIISEFFKNGEESLMRVIDSKREEYECSKEQEDTQKIKEKNRQMSFEDVQSKLGKYWEYDPHFPEKLQDFPYLYAATVKELTMEDEAKSYRLESELSALDTRVEAIRVLKLENSTIFRNALHTMVHAIMPNGPKRSETPPNLIDRIQKSFSEETNKPESSETPETNDVGKLIPGIIEQLYDEICDPQKLPIDYWKNYQFKYLRKILAGEHRQGKRGAYYSKFPERSYLFDFLVVLWLKLVARDTQRKQNELLYSFSAKTVTLFLKELTGADQCFIAIKNVLPSHETNREKNVIIASADNTDLLHSEIDENWLTSQHLKDLPQERIREHTFIEFYRREDAASRSIAEFDAENLFVDDLAVDSVITLSLAGIEAPASRKKKQEMRLKTAGVLTLVFAKDPPNKLMEKLRLITLLQPEMVRHITENYSTESYIAFMKQRETEFYNYDRVINLGELFNSVGHEFYNRLAVVGSTAQNSKDYLDDLTNPESNENERNGYYIEIKNNLDLIDKYRHELADRIGNYRELSREDAASRIDVDLICTFEKASAFLEERLKGKKIELKTQLGEEVSEHPIFANEGRIRMMFINLLTNAIDAIVAKKERDGPKVIEVQFVFEESEQRHRLIFADRGIGIPPSIKKKIFQINFTTKEIDRGNGIGLWFTKRLVNELGGKITVDSQLGVDTTFTILLPVTPMKEKKTDAPI